jgi:alpha-galactosidase
MPIRSSQLGIQWDLRRTTPAERGRIAAWCALYKRHRALLHSGRLHRVDLGAGLAVTGVVGTDASEAIFSYAQLDEIVPVPPRLRIPGLEPTAGYAVSRVTPEPLQPSDVWPVDGVVATGAVLGARGLPGPLRRPQSAEIIHLRRVD